VLGLIALLSWHTAAAPPRWPILPDQPGQPGPALEQSHPLTGTAALRQQRAPFDPHPILYDDFSRPADSVLPNRASGIAQTRLANGQYSLQLDAPDTVGWSLVAGGYGDIALQVESSTPPAQQATVASGLIFRYQDSDNFYLFNVANNGLYSLERVQNGEWGTFIGWTPSHAIRTSSAPSPASPVTNTLRLETSGPYITMKVNGILLETTMDNSVTSGQAGLAITTFAEGPGVVSFDNLSLFQKRE